MTVILAAISEASEPVLVSDTKVFERPGEKALKTLRLNDHCAVGCSCNSVWGGSVFAALFGKHELEFTDARLDVIQELENAGAERADLDCCSAIHKMDKILKRYEELRARCGGEMDVNFLLCGSEGATPVIATWLRSGSGWICHTTSGVDSDRPLRAFLVPGGISAADREMDKTQNAFYDRIGAACGAYAKRFPNMVNEDLWIRRPANRYFKEPLDQLTTSN